ncbi:restriction endonuclease subunit S [Mycoplasmopsis gallinarum]
MIDWEREREELVKILLYIFDIVELTLNDVSIFINGFGFKSSHSNENFENNKIIKIANLKSDGSLNINNADTFSKSEYQVNLEKYKIFENDILIAMSGATIGKVAFVNKNFNDDLYINQRVGIIRFNKNVNSKFMYFAIESKISNWVNNNVFKSAQPNIGSEDIKKISIYLPKLEVQNKITYVLDNFEAICKDLNIGLPAEIEKRQQQFEFYRDQIFYYLENNTLDNRLRERERERPHSGRC